MDRQSRSSLSGRGTLHTTLPSKIMLLGVVRDTPELPIYLDLCLYFGRVFFPIFTEFFGSDLAVFNNDLLINSHRFYLYAEFVKTSDKTTLLLSM